jgi:hypothetical protein
MTGFRFSLQKVLDWRKAQLDREQVRFEQQAAAVAELDRARADLEASGLRTEVQVRGWNPVAGVDLAALANHRLYMKAERQKIDARRVDAQKKLAAQQSAVLEARRRFRLLERLKERRQAEWQHAADKEMEEIAAESYLARWNRRLPYNEDHDS